MPPGRLPPPAEAIRLLHGEGLPDGRIAQAMQALGYHRSWTRRKVAYWRRRRLKLRRLAPRKGWERPRAEAESRRRLHQTVSGWGHLPGRLRLRPRDCDILSLLRDRGPLTASALARLLRLASAESLTMTGPRRLTRLCRLGLVERVPGWPPLYRVQARALPQVEPRATKHG